MPNKNPVKQMANKDYYNILGVSESASDQEIKRAYRELAKKYHPDKHQGDKTAEERFKEISEAYAVLSDSKKRAQYDQMRRFGGGGGGFQGDFDFQDLSSIFGGGFRGRRSAGGGGFGDIFSDLFGGGFSQQPRKGNDITAELTVPFDVAVKGGKQIVEVNGRRLSVNIPAGADEGKKIRLRGQGGAGLAGGPNGDLIIELHIAPHPHFTRKGADLYSVVPINIAQAILGGKARVVTYGKGVVDLKIPAGTQPGKQFRLNGMGIEVNGKQGDHIVKVKLIVPQNLSSKAKAAFEEFAKLAKLSQQ